MLLSQDGKRAATWEIMKNKGLTPHRKKANRNPRVKKKEQYDKKVKARKGQVRDVLFVYIYIYTLCTNKIVCIITIIIVTTPITKLPPLNNYNYNYYNYYHYHYYCFYYYSIKPPSQVREVLVGQAANYGGELTGIKANIARSRKIY